MKRLFWLLLGALLGIGAFRRLSRVLQELPGVSAAVAAARGVSTAAVAGRGFAADTLIGMRERERQLRAEAGLDGAGAAHRRPGGRPEGTPVTGARVDDVQPEGNEQR